MCRTKDVSEKSSLKFTSKNLITQIVRKNTCRTFRNVELAKLKIKVKIRENAFNLASENFEILGFELLRFYCMKSE